MNETVHINMNETVLLCVNTGLCHDRKDDYIHSPYL